MDGIIKELLRRSTKPLVPQIEQGWNTLADQVNDPNSGSSNVPLQTAKGAVAGAMQGLGKVAGDATSPLGILMLLAGAKGLGGATRAVDLPTPTLPAEFTPVGAEPPVVSPRYPDPLESTYHRLLARGGR